MACGIADDLVSTVLLASKKPIIVCPAMNTGMLENAATQANIKTLQKQGCVVMNPDSGHLACGTTGAGRLPEVPEIIAFLENYLASQKATCAASKSS
jgi:phosphopantothenoylcysteine decarboxylase/phosphopantothenate--cysteine ligase